MDAISYSHSVKQEKRIKKFIENPDSKSGLVSLPKKIDVDESITIPNGRVVVHPNLEIDGTLTIEQDGELFVPFGGTLVSSDLMHPVDTIADLKNETGKYKYAYVTGYHTKDDGAFGSNIFVWDENNTETDNGGTIIKCTTVTTGRYKLKYSGAVNVKWFGARGDGVTDNHIPIKSAIEYCDENGHNLFFPEGYYYQPYKGHSDENNWARIRKGNIKIYGNGATIENHLIYIGGEYNATVPIGAGGATRGDRNITFATNHGLSVGDVIQILSSVNAGSTDAGYYQMESTNPTNLILGELRLSEIHEVGKVISPTEVSLYGMLVYPHYQDNIANYSQPLAAVTTAEIRKLNVVRNVVISGLNFKSTEVNNFRAILARAAVDIVFEKCFFEAGGKAGQHFKCTDVKGVKFIDCGSRRYPEDVTGSSWNSFIPGGGTSHFEIRGCRFEGEGQTIDFTPGMMSSDPGGSETIAGAKCTQLSVQHIIVTNNQFIRCDNTFTTHPGCYDVIYSDNLAVACSSGFTCRSLKTTISNNILECYEAGLSISAFYHDLTVIGNRITRVPGKALWTGVQLYPLSGEIMNRNNLKRVLIKSNFIYDELGNQQGIQIRHDGNGVPPNPSFTEFTNEIKTALSDYTIEGNHFEGCPIWIGKFVNGVVIKNNTFRGGALVNTDKYISATYQSGKCLIDGNIFLDDKGGLLIGGIDTSLTYDYDQRHTIGQNTQSSSSASKNNIYKAALVPYYSISSEDGSVAKTGNYSATNWTPNEFVYPNGVVTGANALPARYTKVGNVVTVSGRIQLVTNAAGSGQIQMKLPIPSSNVIINGIMIENENGLVGEIFQSSGNNAILNVKNAPTASTYTYAYTFSYEVK